MSFITYLLVLVIMSAIAWPISWLISKRKKDYSAGVLGSMLWLVIFAFLFLTSLWLIDMPSSNTMLVENGRVVRSFPEAIVLWQGTINTDSLISYTAFTKTIEITLPLDTQRKSEYYFTESIEYVLTKKATWHLLVTIGGTPESMLQFRQVIGTKEDSLAIVRYLTDSLKNLIKDYRQELLAAYDLFNGEESGEPCYELVNRYLWHPLLRAGMELKNRPNTVTVKFTLSKESIP